MKRDSYQFGEFLLEPSKRQLSKGGRTVHLTPMDFRLLCVLVQRAGREVPNDVLRQEVWGQKVVETNTISAHISTLRTALGNQTNYIASIGTGYQFTADVTRVENVIEDVRTAPVNADRVDTSVSVARATNVEVPGADSQIENIRQSVVDAEQTGTPRSIDADVTKVENAIEDARTAPGSEVPPVAPVAPVLPIAPMLPVPPMAPVLPVAPVPPGGLLTTSKTRPKPWLIWGGLGAALVILVLAVVYFSVPVDTSKINFTDATRGTMGFEVYYYYRDPDPKIMDRKNGMTPSPDAVVRPAKPKWAIGEGSLQVALRFDDSQNENEIKVDLSNHPVEAVNKNGEQLDFSNTTVTANIFLPAEFRPDPDALPTAKLFLEDDNGNKLYWCPRSIRAGLTMLSLSTSASPPSALLDTCLPNTLPTRAETFKPSIVRILGVNIGANLKSQSPFRYAGSGFLDAVDWKPEGASQ